MDEDLAMEKEALFRKSAKRKERFPLIDTEDPRERALLVGVDRPDTNVEMSTSLEELERLAHTAGADVIATVTQRLRSPNPATFVGSGKVQEISDLANAEDIDVIIIDDELTPSQQSNLEKSVDRSVKVIDRTALILDIFALHAKSREGKLQVRLAQNEYLYPRLRGMWAKGKASSRWTAAWSGTASPRSSES